MQFGKLLDNFGSVEQGHCAQAGHREISWCTPVKVTFKTDVGGRSLILPGEGMEHSEGGVVKNNEHCMRGVWSFL